MGRVTVGDSLGGSQGVQAGKPTARGIATAHALPIGAPCANCAVPLAGAWCHACGQSCDDHHRSLVRLTGEAIGGFFDVDGRLWRTLPSLCVRPARLTRSFLKGHRVTQVPPFRLFLVAVVLVFLVAGIEPQELPRLNLSQPAGRASLQTGSDVNLNFGPGNAVPSNKDPVSKWLTARVRSVAKNPQRFEASLAAWAQRMAILALPLSAGLLGLMFFWRRGVYLFDHLIFSMHSLSFQGLLLASSMLLSQLSGWFGLMLVAAPVHLFAHLKGTYRLGVFGTLARMAVLFLGSLVGFAVALLLLVAIGLYEVGA